MITIILLNEIEFPRTPAIEKFQSWVDVIEATIPEKIPENYDEICISIVDQATIAELNKGYRGKDGPTNVLSFTYEPMPGITQTSLGDCVICPEIVEAEAASQNKTIESHWAHLTIHSVLHLLGYDHIEEDEANIMETLEIQLLSKLGFNNPYEQL
jgi:probable rRNA maturation factor